MAIRGVRQTIRDVIDETSLSAFEDAVETADRLFIIMEKATKPDEAFSLAVGWATAILTLARLESSLLSSVLPLYEADLEPTSEKIAALNQRKADAEAMVYELRGPTIRVAPLSTEVDERRAREIRDAKANRNRVFTKVRDEMALLRVEREPIELTVGRIKLRLRALRHFVETRFPVPLLPSRNPMKPARADPRADPIAAFAQKYVDGMDGRGDAEEQARRAAIERTRIADARPARDWQALKEQDKQRRHAHVQ